MIEDRFDVYKSQFIIKIWISAVLLFSLALSFSLFYNMFISNPAEKSVANFQAPVKRSSLNTNLSLDQDFFEEVTSAVKNHINIPMPKIEDQLLYYGYNDRPDCNASVTHISLGIKGREEKRSLLPGEKLFFHCQDVNEISFSDLPTPYWIELNILPNRDLEIVSHVEYIRENGELIYSNSYSTILSKKLNDRALEEEDPFLRSIVAELSQSELYMPDQLFNFYAGDLFSEERGAYRLRLGQEENQLLFVKEGDLLSWSEGKWSRGELKTQGKPLLWIKSISPHRAFVIFWDREGFSSISRDIPIRKGTPSFSKPSEIFSMLHQRSASQVTCRINNKNVILNKDDWLVKGKNGWRTISTLEEFKDLLIGKIKGELFVFDGIEQNNGSTYFTGHLFDENREAFQKVEIPLKEKKNRKKKGAK